MTRLQNLIRLNELAESIHKQGKKVAVLLEGRDGAGKSGTIRNFTHYLPPYTYRVINSFMPTKSLMANWLKGWSLLMPNKGEIVFYDRSHYSRALLQPIMNWCSQKQYENFMTKVIDWENNQDIYFVKLWLSISKKEQDIRLNNREVSPLTYWKFSKNDKKSLSAFDKVTLHKEYMFNDCPTWHSINYNDKTQGRDIALETLIRELEKC
jgi:polyphosphate kinase 2 (PPK2 family)|tara:strand:+ start:938 stop:1564 length:627 start_codon:yes stop_codon:yes gene_type:complete